MSAFKQKVRESRSNPGHSYMMLLRFSLSALHSIFAPKVVLCECGYSTVHVLYNCGHYGRVFFLRSFFYYRIKKKTMTTATNVEEEDFMHPGTRYESVLFESADQNKKNDLPHILSSKAKVITVLESYETTDDISSFKQHTQRQLDYDDDDNFQWTVSSIEDPKYKNNIGNTILEKWKDLSTQFFQTYPECQILSYEEDSSSNEDFSEDEVEILAHCPEMIASEKLSRVSHPSQQNPVERLKNREKIRNPYNNISSVQKRTYDRVSLNETAHHMGSQFSTPPKDEHHQNRNEWDNFKAHKNKNSSWDEGTAKSNIKQYNSAIQYQENPFCTANEFTAEYSNDNGYHQRQNQNYNSQGNDKNSGNPSTSFSAQSSVNANRPPISAGLRKKFQMPKPKISNNSPSTKNSHNSNGRGGMESQKNTGKNNDKDDAEELPPELAHLDKELVDKILNEIFCGSDQTKITFDDIAGLRNAKQTVLELVCWPMKRPDLFTGLRKGPNGLLLFGPPGTGKTLIGKAIASESGATFFSISSSSLTSKWIGEGEKLVRTLFSVAAYKEPAVVFIDEIDSLLTQRKSDENEASRRIKTEFLVQLGTLTFY